MYVCRQRMHASRKKHARHEVLDKSSQTYGPPTRDHLGIGWNVLSQHWQQSSSSGIVLFPGSRCRLLDCSIPKYVNYCCTAAGGTSSVNPSGNIVFHREPSLQRSLAARMFARRTSRSFPGRRHSRASSCALSSRFCRYLAYWPSCQVVEYGNLTRMHTRDGDT